MQLKYMLLFWSDNMYSLHLFIINKITCSLDRCLLYFAHTVRSDQSECSYSNGVMYRENPLLRREVLCFVVAHLEISSPNPFMAYFFLMPLSTELGIPFMNYKLSFSSVTLQNRCNMSATKPINESALILHDSALGSNI